MKKTIGIILTGAAVGALLAAFTHIPSAQATTIVNGNFETGPFGVAPTGFTVSPGNSVVALQASDFIPCCNVIGSAAQLANHFASFGAGNRGAVSTLSQILSTREGDRYTISFDFAALGRLNRSAGIIVNAFEANTDALLGTFSTETTTDNNLATTFERHTFRFIGASSATRLSFSLDPAFDPIDVAGVLDNVAAAVPEPATWAMMITGFGMVGGTMRRRRTRVQSALA